MTAEQRSRQLWLVPSAGQTGHHLVADVAVDAHAAGLRAYAVPDTLVDAVHPGVVVRVPFGRSDRPRTGLCLRVTERPWDHTRKPVLDAQPGFPWLTEPLVELGLWVADYYICSPWKTFTAVLPAVVRKPRLRKVAYVRATGRTRPEKLPPGQAALLAALGTDLVERADALQRAAVTAATMRALCKRRLAEIVVRHEPRENDERNSAPPAPAPDVESPEDAYALIPGQQAALDQVRSLTASADPFRVCLLHGVPGSGKTEVYVRAFREVIRSGRQGILLIPEIALATQVVDRLLRRFARVAVVHSRLPAARRRDTLRAIATGQVDVVIGTRTAVFAPCPRLGLIVVDEEQEGSFKNLAAPYYHARDVAIKRGQIERVPVLLGSATPALESWHNAHERPHYTLIRLPDRVPGAQLPATRLVARATRSAQGHVSVLSPELRTELAATLDAGQQAILLHNRRGYAMHLRCADCGLVATCQRCGTYLTYHRVDESMKCHHCGQRTPAPKRCLDDTCGGQLERVGLAIQRLEEDLHRAFPTARLQRLDSDTMRRRDDYRAALDRFENRDADILLGTQMVAKGLDFPDVRLVGVIEADAALSLPDFRAGERVFQLIMQVVGRAGRRAGSSLALVQTGERPASTIHHALHMDYESFATEELAARQRFNYPPFARMLRLICADDRPNRARQAAERLAEALRIRAGRIHAAIQVEPPEPCAIPRLRGFLRHQVLVRAPRDVALQRLFHETGAERLWPPNVQRCVLDVDPVDFL